jgi:hypothetical protein
MVAQAYRFNKNIIRGSIEGKIFIFVRKKVFIMLKFRTIFFYFMLVGLIIIGTGYAEGDEGDNILVNGDFEDGIVDPWSTYGDASISVVDRLRKAAVDEDVIEGDFCLEVSVAAKGANFWDSGLQHAGHTFEKGKVYTLSAYLKSADGPLQINFKPELGQDPWTGYGARAFVMTEEWKEYHITTPPMPADVNPATITFHIGYDIGTFWVDNVRFYEGESEEVPVDDPELDPEIGLENGGFESGLTTPWTLYGNGSIEVVRKLNDAFISEDPVEGRYVLHVTVNEAGANFWDTGLQHTGHVLKAGEVYTLAAFLKSKEGPLQINFKPELAVDPWTGYGAKEFTMTDEWEEYYITTPPMPQDVDPASLTFHIAYTKGEFWIDGVRFYEGEYEEPDFSTPRAVRPQGKLRSTWGKIKAD